MTKGVWFLLLRILHYFEENGRPGIFQPMHCGRFPDAHVGVIQVCNKKAQRQET